MLNSIVGPPLAGVADFKSPENTRTEFSKDAKAAGSDSFGDVLESKSPKPLPQKEKASPDKIGKADPGERRKPESDKEDKVTAIKGNGVENKTKVNSQRQNAILNFMDSFESEFGVPPTRLVEAMANLKPGDQAEAPEATADQVIDQLGLDDQQEDQAKEMYLGLLAQLAQIEKNPQPLPPPKLAPEAMYSSDAKAAGVLQAQERFSTAQEKLQVLNQSLDSLNQKFWMKNDKLPSPLAGNEPLPEASLQSLNKQEVLPQAQPAVPPEAALAALVKAARAVKNKVELPVSPQEIEGLGVESEEEEGPAERPSAAAPGAAKTALSGEAAAIENAGASANKGFESSQQNSQDFANPPGEGASREASSKAKSGDKADFKKSLRGSESSLPLSVHTLKGEALPTDLAATEAAVAAGPAPGAPGGSGNEVNIRQIMNQASYLIKKGGGEMKVQMTPEGLGQIHMKVLVQDGKVNVQMAADTPEAKKTLESGLAELKNNLAAHKLSMDHVKIDVVAGPNTDNTSQNQTSQNSSGGREQAQKFWNNFSENFGSPRQQRDNFTDVPSLRGYARPRTDRPLEPIQTAGVRKYASAGKGKGLDLVA